LRRQQTRPIEVTSQAVRDCVARAIPAGITVPPAFWDDLDDAIRLYRVQQQRRTETPPLAERRRFERLIRQTDALAAELRALRRHHPDGVLADNARRALPGLYDFRQRADAHLEVNKARSSAVRGRRSFYRAALYAAFLDLWVYSLAQPLCYSRAPTGGPACGPLIRFFTACAKAAMGTDAPKADTIADIIDRHPARRKARRKDK
jgi:hypothetical protein